jgi:hypothetical protein
VRGGDLGRRIAEQRERYRQRRGLHHALSGGNGGRNGLETELRRLGVTQKNGKPSRSDLL